MKHRIIGFDLARAYAVFGMFVVNFNIVFGSLTDESRLGQFLSLFNGNSSTMFVILAGMGVALMTNRPAYAPEEKRALRSVVVKRSWFLFFAGLLLYNWWSADILHFYGGYLHIAALLLFVPKRFYLLAAAAAIVIFHLLLAVIPYETGWNFETLQYNDFWTPAGFLRNTFYNGWNPIFPWSAFFLLGMWLGRLDWSAAQTKRRLLLSGTLIFLFTEFLRTLAGRGVFDADLNFYLTADYLPPFLPFMLGATGFALVFITVCIRLGEKFAGYKPLEYLAATGRMTLTHYVAHLTIGLVFFAVLTGKTDFAQATRENAISPFWILIYAAAFFLLSLAFSVLWSRKYKNGPLEALMRKFSG